LAAPTIAMHEPAIKAALAIGLIQLVIPIPPLVVTFLVTALRFNIPVRENRAPKFAVIVLCRKKLVHTARYFGRAPIAALTSTGRVLDAALAMRETAAQQRY
jgi:hypothetical protein